MKFISKQKGFTLIELLVVIAIIGILASIVMVTFPSARKKAMDSRVKSAVSQARTVMIYYWGNTNSYLNFSTTNAEMTILAKEVHNNSYQKSDLQIFATSGTCCMSARLNEKDGATYYCADGSGMAGVVSSPCLTASGTCGVIIDN
jgi:prepilin-type N-terminal cleavage/methylation domain-containing protein